MVVYQYIRNNTMFATPSFELAHHRNQQGNVSTEVITSASTPDYYYEESCKECHVPQRYHVSGKITPCGCPASPILIAETWQQEQMHWHMKAIHKRIYTPDETN